MVMFQSNSNGAAYTAANPHFKKLYVDSSYSTPWAQSDQTEAWEDLNRYVPFFSGSYGLPGDCPEPDPLDQLVSHRSEILKSQVDSLIHQLYERAKIHEANLKRLDYDMVKVDSELLQLEDLMKWDKFDPPQTLARRQQGLESELLNIERQRRDEDTSFWKDGVLIRKDLTEALGGLAAARVRGNALNEVARYGI